MMVHRATVLLAAYVAPKPPAQRQGSQANDWWPEMLTQTSPAERAAPVPPDRDDLHHPLENSRQSWLCAGSVVGERLGHATNSPRCLFQVGMFLTKRFIASSVLGSSRLTSSGCRARETNSPGRSRRTPFVDLDRVGRGETEFRPCRRGFRRPSFRRNQADRFIAVTGKHEHGGRLLPLGSRPRCGKAAPKAANRFHPV